MNEDDHTLHKLIAAAHKPLTGLTMDLAAMGYDTHMIARLFIQTAFALIRTHYSLDDVRKVCDHELDVYYKTWNKMN